MRRSKLRNVTVVTALLLAGCNSNDRVIAVPPNADAGFDGGSPDASQPQPDANCPVPCGSNCCGERQQCTGGRCEPICVPDCDGRECGPDGCGSVCGTCGAEATCNPATFLCDPICTPETPAETCQRRGRGCGVLDTQDNCGNDVSVDCGQCTAPAVCDATHQCKCPAESDETFCGRKHIACGPAIGTDNCGAPRQVNDCGSCDDTIEQCVGGACTCRPDDLGTFCARYGKECGALIGSDRCGPRTENCGACTSPETCGANGLCRGSTPTNDTCARPEVLRFDASGVATASGETMTATKDSTGSCGGSSGPDVVYSFTTGTAGAIRATVAPGAGTPVLYLQQSTCGGTEWACNLGTSGNPMDLVVPNLPPGTWFLWVDSNSATGASFTLTVKLELPMAGPPNDLCTGAEVLAFDPVTGKATATGDTTGAQNDDSGLCAAMTGPDVVYAFTTTTDSAFVATVARVTASSASFQPVLWLRTLCPASSSADQVACATSTSGTTKLLVPLLPAGTYYLVVDGLNSRYGAFTLSAELKPPQFNDTCAGAEELLLDAVTGIAEVTGDTSTATADYTGACASVGRDLVYSFTTAAEKTVEIQLTPSTGSTVRASLYMRTNCTDPATEVICTKIDTVAAAVRIIRGRLPAGTYYVFVDATQSGVGGPFTLSVAASDPPQPPAHDVCAGALAIVPDPVTGKASITGETTYGINDYTATCGTTDGPDLVYSLTVSRDTYLAATLTRDAADTGFRPALYLRPDCPGSTTAPDASCDLYLPYESGATNYDYSWNTGWADVVAMALPSGTYFLVVDGSHGSAGHFTLDVQTGPARLNNSCAAPEVLSFDANGVAVATGNTRYSTNQTQGPCGGSYGNELIYQFTTTGVGSLSILLDQLGGTGQATTVYLRTACADRATEKSAWCFYASGGHSATLDLPRFEAGTYYLFADDFGSSLQGPFQLTVTSTLFPPVNDTCALATELQFDLITQKTSAQGDITQGNDNYSGLCGYTRMIGVDHVYSVQLRELASLTAKVTSDASRNLNVYIRSDCESDSSFDQVACGTGSAGVSTASAASVPPGRYYIFVDGYQASYTGTYTLEVSYSTPPTNSTCLRPQFLAFDAATGVATATGDTAMAPGNTLGTCQAANAGELVYSFTTADVKDVDVFVKPQTGSSYRGYAYVRTSCDDATTEVGCSFNTASSASTHVPLLALPAGTYFVFVDTPSATSYRGPFELSVTATAPAARPANDTCATAQALNLPAQGQVTITADTTTAVNDYRGNCGAADAAMTGGDLVYSFVLSQRSQVLVEHTRSATTYKPGFYIRRTCEVAADEVGCLVNTNTGSANNTKTIAAVLEAGTYYLIVDGAVHTGGAFTMKVSTYPMIPGDTCDSAVPITFNTSGVAQLLGDNTNATDLAAGVSCQTTPTTGGDVVYTFTTTTLKDVTVVAKNGASGAYKPYVYLRSNCAQASSELGCAYNSATSNPTANLRVNRLQPGTYYLFVDSYVSSSLTGKGLYDVTVTLIDSPAAPTNDTCAGATELDLSSGTATVTGSTVGASNDYSHYGMCGSSKTPLFGNDVVYAFTLRVPAVVVAETTRTASTYAPVTYIRSVCASPLQKDQQTCSTSVSSNVNATLPVGLGAGTYYVIVDGGNISASGPSAGDFTLKVTATASPAPVAGDSCFNAPMLPAFDANGVATITGTTDGGTHHGEGSCYGFGSATYPDVVYGFALARASTVKVEVAPTTGSALHADVYIRRDCADKGSELFCAYKTTSDPVSTVLQALPPGTYYVWVKAVSSASGPFNLTVTQFQPPTNDACSGVAELAFDTTGTVGSVVSRTDGALDDAGGTCGGAGTADSVFHFALTAQKKIVATVKRDPAAPVLEPVVYLRRSCSSGLASDEYSCGTSWYGTATAAVHSAAPGDYYVWVDGLYGTTGGYRLQVVLSTPDSSAPNESCFAPAALQFVNNQAGALGTTSAAYDEASGSCSSPGAAEVVYSVVLPTAKAILATVTPVDPAFQPAVYIRSACAGSLSSDERSCAAARAPGTAAAATVEYAPAGTYYVWVDGARAGMAGDFNLLVELQSPVLPPSNDACAAAISLTRGAAVTGDTRHAVDDYGGALSAGCGGGQYAGPDLVYSYTPAAAGDFTVTVGPAAAWDAAVWITPGICGGTGALCAAAANAGGAGLPETATYIGATAGTTYFIVVDGARRSDAGAFSLSVQ